MKPEFMTLKVARSATRLSTRLGACKNRQPPTPSKTESNESHLGRHNYVANQQVHILVFTEKLSGWPESPSIIM
jgi:hypothetical protein